MEIGSLAAHRLEKSSRSRICATVTVRTSRNSSSIGMSSHSELKRTSSRSSSASTFPACSTYVRAWASISSPERTGRVAERPLGSPTRAV